MTLKPIPTLLLCDSFTLKVPGADGYSITSVTDVRVVRKSRISDFTTSRTRDETALTIYYDCTNSYPQGLSFSAGMTAVFCGEEFEILEAVLFSGEQPHHWKLTARKTGGEHV